MKKSLWLLLGLLTFSMNGCAQTMESSLPAKEMCPSPDSSFPTVRAHLAEMIQDYNNHSVAAFERYSDPNVKITRIQRGGKPTSVQGKAVYINFLRNTFQQLDPKWENPCVASVEQARDQVKAIVRYTFFWRPPNENYTRDPGQAILYFTPDDGMFVDGTFFLNK